MAVLISSFLNVKPSVFYFGGNPQEALKAKFSLQVWDDGWYMCCQIHVISDPN